MAFPFNKLPLKDIAGSFNVGVSFFFFLSGFIMFVAYYSENGSLNIKAYFKNRLARIYPLYIFSLLLFFIFSSSKLDFHELTLNLTLLQSWVPGYALTTNFPGWSLSVEWFFYLSFPFLLKFIQKYKYGVLIIMAFWVISQICFAFMAKNNIKDFNTREFIFYHPVMHLNEFAMGLVLGKLYVRNNVKISQPISYALITISVTAIFLLLYRSTWDPHNGLFVILYIPLILGLLNPDTLVSKIFSCRSFILLGEISFGIYLLQYPVYLVFSKIFEVDYFSSHATRFYLFFLVLLLFSLLSYITIEKPLRVRIRKWL